MKTHAKLPRNGFLSPAVLEMCVLSLLSRGDGYGYKLSKEIGLDVAESTLYPVLRRLEASGFLTSYGDTHNSKLRKVYSITPQGVEQFYQLKSEWIIFREMIDGLLAKAG